MMHMEVFANCTWFEKCRVFVTVAAAAAAAAATDLLGFIGTNIGFAQEPGSTGSHLMKYLSHISVS